MSRSLSLICRHMLRDELLTKGAFKQIFGNEICSLKKIQRTSWFLGLNFSKAYLTESSLLTSPTREGKWGGGSQDLLLKPLWFLCIWDCSKPIIYRSFVFHKMTYSAACLWQLQAEKPSWWQPLHQGIGGSRLYFSFPLLTREIL